MNNCFRNPFRSFIVSFFALARLLAAAAHAADATWNGATDATWATETNWSASPVPGTGAIAPGVAEIGTLTAGAADPSTGTLAIGIDGASSGKLLSTGTVTPGGTLQINLGAGGFSETSYVSTEGNPIMGTFSSVTEGYDVSHSGTQVAITETSTPFDTFRAQYIEYNTRSLISNSQAQNHINNQRADGTWSDINYTDKTSGGWKTVQHLQRVRDLSRVYIARENFSNREVLRQAIVKALEHWFDNDYKNPNWYWNRIGAPKEAAEALVLMGDAVPASVVQKALSNVLSDSRTNIDMRRVGANRISMAGIEILKGWIRKENDRTSHAATIISNEIKIVTGEGIQPDYSYHMHENMLQMRTYGLATITMMNQWIHVLRGTNWAFSAEKIEIIRNFILEGHTWLIWNGMYDYNAMARNLSGQSSVASSIHGVMRDMIKVDPNAKAAYELRLRWPNELIGSKVFWRSDYAVHRQADWYASIRMKSTRLIGGENTNGDNPEGLHCASGSQMVSITGKEYENISTLWNWHRLPGTTVDQGITDLTPPSRELMKGNSNFVGGLGDGAAGVAVMVYELDGFNAKKSWFFEGNAVIALGAGINGPTLGNAFTSVEQSRRSGTVASSMGNLSSGTTPLPAGGWVHHAGIGYKINNAANVFLPASPNTFSVWINHGNSPQNDTYSYTIYPLTTAGNMSTVIANHTTQVLSNTPDLQATEGAHGLHAVFYKAGSVTLKNGDVVSVNAPCVLSLRGNELLVCDPARSLGSVDVVIRGKRTTVQLPSGAEGGAKVSMAVEPGYGTTEGTHGEMSGLVEDTDIRDDLVIFEPTLTTLVPGRSGASPGFNRASVFVFQLPDLGQVSNPFTSATFTFNVTSVSTTPPGVDLYGLGKRAAPTVLDSDYYGESAIPDPTDAILIQSNLLSASTETGIKSSSAASAMASYLNTQYDSGNGIGNYVFLRLSTNGAVASLRRHFVTSADGALSNPSLGPRVSYTAIAGENFNSWIEPYNLPSHLRGFNDDPDGDGLTNGIEAWFGSHPGEFTAGLTQVGTSGLVTTFTHPQNPTSPIDIVGSCEWSENLVDWYSGDGADGPGTGLTVSISSVVSDGVATVTATSSSPAPGLFVRAKVEQIP